MLFFYLWCQHQGFGALQQSEMSVTHLLDQRHHPGHEHDAGGLWGVVHAPNGGRETTFPIIEYIHCLSCICFISSHFSCSLFHAIAPVKSMLQAQIVVMMKRLSCLQASFSLLMGWSGSSWEGPRHRTRWY